MAKLYTKNTWADEVLAAAERYNVAEDDGTPIHTSAQIALATSVVQAGTAVDADRMNNIEDGVDAIDTRLDDLDGTWVDYSASSTVSGWSGTPTVKLVYKVVGDLVLVTFSITGTSNATTASFTLPDAPGDGYGGLALCRTRDANVVQTAPGMVEAISGNTTFNLYKSADTTALWTASSTKSAWGQFFYFK